MQKSDHVKHRMNKKCPVEHLFHVLTCFSAQMG